MDQDPIDLAICAMLPSIEDARKGIKEVHFLPFNPTEKRAAMTYTTPDGKMHRATKGAPEQILALAANREAIETKVNDIMNKFADHGLRSLGVAYQVRICVKNHFDSTSISAYLHTYIQIKTKALTSQSS